VYDEQVHAFLPCMSQLSPPLRHWLKRSRTTEILKRSEFITFLKTWPTFLKTTRRIKPPLFNGDVRTIDIGVQGCILDMKAINPMKLFIFGIGVSLLYFAVTTQALEDMTRQDCEVHNIQAACSALRK